jgi:hypothetical protein
LARRLAPNRHGRRADDARSGEVVAQATECRYVMNGEAIVTIHGPCWWAWETTGFGTGMQRCTTIAAETGAAAARGNIHRRIVYASREVMGRPARGQREAGLCDQARCKHQTRCRFSSLHAEKFSGQMPTSASLRSATRRPCRSAAR